MKKHFVVMSALMLLAASSVLAQSPDRSKWPTKLVHPDMPVYQGGRLKGWNQWDKSNEYSIFILIENTNKADLSRYIALLKAAGFEEKNSDTYHKGLFDVRVQFNSETILQISSSKISGLEWPTALLKSVPEQKKGTLTGMIEPSEEMPDYLQLYYINLTRQDILVWLQDLQKAGFTVEGLGASKAKMTLNGKTYQSLSIQIEDNGETEWMIDFNYSN